MRDGIDWSVTTFDGNRRRQLNEFRALSFRDKLRQIEQMGEVVEHFTAGRISSQAKRRGSEPQGDQREGTSAGAAKDTDNA